MRPLSKELVQESITVTPLDASDIPKLAPILFESVVARDTGEPFPDEIEQIQGYMRGNLDEHNRRRNYLVARDISGEVYGCMAVAEPEPDMLNHFQTTAGESDELLNAFVSKSARGKGVGQKLLKGIGNLSRSRGKKYMTIHSGPRYELTAWGFYDKNADRSHGFITDKYGEGRHAKTWSINL